MFESGSRFSTVRLSMQRMVSGLLCFNVTLFLLLPAAYAKQPVQPLDIFDVESVSSTQISADGERVAYLKHKADIRDDRYKRELWVVDYQGDNAKLVSDTSQSPGKGVWSADNKKLAFVANSDGSRQIHLYDVESGQVTRLSSLAGSPASLVWSPDNSKIAFTLFVPKVEGIEPISPAPKAPKGAKWADAPVEITEQYYRWDGAGYRKPGTYQLFVYDLKKNKARQVSKGEFDHAGPYTLNSKPSWTPDGKSIVMSLIRDKSRINDFELISHVYQYKVSNGKVRQITDYEGVEKAATVSPDGKSIAYIGFDNKPGAYYHNDVYIKPLKGGNPVNLTEDFDESVSAVQWAHHNRSLYIQYEDRGYQVISELSLDGKLLLQVFRGLGRAGDGLPYSEGVSFSLAPTGRYAVSSSTLLRPSDALVGSLGTNETRPVSNVAQTLLSKVEISPAEEFVVASTNGDHEIQGWLIKPPGFDPRKKYPLMIEMHGGPYAAYSPQFSFQAQLMASRGYIVAYANPRGSTGYGKDFLNAINYKFPIPDGDDILDVADNLESLEFVDTDNLFLAGGSGGGLLTSSLISRTHRFNASAILYPVTNWGSITMAGDKPNKFSHAFFKTTPWLDPESYADRSPITHVGSVKTPSIIITGEEDYRTPMSQSEEYYGALKLLGVDAVLIRFPHEPHGLSAIPSHSMRTPLYVVDWFDRYRK